MCKLQMLCDSICNLMGARYRDIIFIYNTRMDIYNEFCGPLTDIYMKYKKE